MYNDDRESGRVLLITQLKVSELDQQLVELRSHHHHRHHPSDVQQQPKPTDTSASQLPTTVLRCNGESALLMQTVL